MSEAQITPPRPPTNDLATTAEAQDALAKAQVANRSAGTAIEGISPAQAESLLHWMVDTTREDIYNGRRYGQNLSFNEYFTTPTCVAGSCGLSQGRIAFHAEAMGMDSVTHQLAEFSDGALSARHAFGTVAMPVQGADGHVRMQQYLVDGTFAQFMAPDKYASGPETAGWGPQLSSTPEGKMIADGLLRNGFVPIEPGVAERYIGNARFDRITGQPDTRPIQQLDEKFSRNTVANDFALPELADSRDMRTPSQILAGAPKEAIYDLHPDGRQAGYPAEAAGTSRVPPPLKQERSSVLNVTPERFPHLTPEQLQRFKAIGPLPAYTYRANPDAELFPINTRSGNWDGFLQDSVDREHLPPARADGSRSLLYVGDLPTAANYANTWDRLYPDANGEYRPLDAFTREEQHQLDGSEGTPDQSARERNRLYRMSTADLIDRFTPDTVMLRDTGQQGTSFAIVGELREPVPAAHIQHIGNDAEGNRVFVDRSTGKSLAGSISDIATLEPPLERRAAGSPMRTANGADAVRGDASPAAKQGSLSDIDMRKPRGSRPMRGFPEAPATEMEAKAVLLSKPTEELTARERDAYRRYDRGEITAIEAVVAGREPQLSSTNPSGHSSPTGATSRVVSSFPPSAEAPAAPVPAPATPEHAQAAPRGFGGGVELHAGRAAGAAGFGMGVYALSQKFGKDGTYAQDVKTDATLANASVAADVGGIAAGALQTMDFLSRNKELGLISVGAGVVSGGINTAIAVKAGDGHRAANSLGAAAGGLAGGFGAAMLAAPAAAAAAGAGAAVGAQWGAGIGVFFGGPPGAAIGAAIGATVGAAVGGGAVLIAAGTAGGALGGWAGGEAGEALGGKALQNYLNSNVGKSNVANLVQQLNQSGWARALGNHDSKATEAELKAYLAKSADGKAIDTNHDGKISGGELQRHMQAHGATVDNVLRKEMGGLLGQMDSTGWSRAVGNHDNKATLDEVMATLKANKITMQELDKNNDGKVSGGELQRGLEAHHIKRPATSGRA